jgi:hypothetical protein
VIRAGDINDLLHEQRGRGNLREDLVIGHVDQWLAREFARHRLTETIRDLAAPSRPARPAM